MWGCQHNPNAIGITKAVHSCATVATADTQRKKRSKRLASDGKPRALDIKNGQAARAVPIYS